MVQYLAEHGADIDAEIRQATQFDQGEVLAWLGGLEKANRNNKNFSSIYIKSSRHSKRFLAFNNPSPPPTPDQIVDSFGKLRGTSEKSRFFNGSHV